MDTNKLYEVYVIKSENNRYYIGLSENADKRLKEHNQGLSKWTKRDKNWQIIYRKKCNNLTEARKWENYLKKQKGGQGFKRLVQDVPGP
jgi:putative endonuclease